MQYRRFLPLPETLQRVSRCTDHRNQEATTVGRYCLESAKTAAKAAILHEQSCPFYELASLLAEGRINDLGTYLDVLGAVNSLHMSSEQLVCCPHCCAIPSAMPAAPPERPANRSSLQY
jgi:hypothetical protein